MKFMAERARYGIKDRAGSRALGRLLLPSSIGFLLFALRREPLNALIFVAFLLLTLLNLDLL